MDSTIYDAAAREMIKELFDRHLSIEKYEQSKMK
jgi:hypothetical protein